jgi:hypothetical protein
MTNKRYLLDFEVESHACLPAGKDQIRTRVAAQDVEIYVSNLSVLPGTDRPLLSFQVICFEKSLGDAKVAGTQHLKDYLDYLTFATNLTFRVHKLIRVVDWSVGLSERDCNQFQSFPGSELPYNVLEKPIFESVEKLLQIEVTSAQRRALKWFSAGIRAEYLDDQFQFFWLVLELVAQLDKPPQKVNDMCATCKGFLFCKTCNSFPMHRPYPKQAISSLFERTIKENALEFFSQANALRNSIMHGDEISTIEAERGIKLSDVVNHLGALAWTALLNQFHRKTEDRERLGKLNLVETNMYAHQTLTMTLNMLVYTSDPDDPRISELAKPTIELQVEDDSRTT